MLAPYNFGSVYTYELDYNILVLTLFIRMDYPIHIDTNNMDLSILKLKGLPVKISINGVLLFLNIVVIVTNSADHNEMPHCAAFHLCLHLFPLDSYTCMYKE